MKINTVNEYRVEVELCAEEMARLGLSFDTMDWENIDTRRALWSLVGLMRERGVNISLSGRLLIEAGKLPDGVKLCFTRLPGGKPKRLRIKKETAPPVLRCETLRDAERAARVLPGCTFYRSGSAVFLLAEGTYAEARLLRAAEFGSLTRAPMGREILEEYAQKLSKEELF